MATSVRYVLTELPEARNDGSGCVAHQLTAQYNTGDGWVVVPGRNKTFNVPADELVVVLAMPNGAAKETAYKQLLADNINTNNNPVTGWDKASLVAMIDANDLASAQADGANTYITVTLGLTPPIPFQL